MTALFGLRQCRLHDLRRDARDLDVHLQRGDALLGARDLEVHVAEVILVAQNIGQHRVFATVFEDQAHGDTGDGRLERNARIHHRQRAAADRRHRA